MEENIKVLKYEVEKEIDSDFDYKVKESRYRIVDTETGEILDDAQGYGYKTAQNAHKAWYYKNNRKSIEKDKKIFREFLKNNKKFDREVQNLFFYSIKDGDDVTKEDIEKLAKEMNVTLPFDAKKTYKLFLKH